MRLPFNPVERAREVENIVMKGKKRKYYRFRFARYYGGIVTADTVGCCLLCAYCWNYFKNVHPERYGNFYSPEQVSDELTRIARERGCYTFRISGAEPILGRKSMKHIVEVIELVDSKFILETNGLMLGYMPELADELIGLNVAVRVTIKGWDEESFERITGARREFFKYQLKALEVLRERWILFWPAIMYDIFGDRGISELRRRLGYTGYIEYEYLEKYPFVVENLRKRGIRL